jgi:hypothetical protein
MTDAGQSWAAGGLPPRLRGVVVPYRASAGSRRGLPPRLRGVFSQEPHSGPALAGLPPRLRSVRQPCRWGTHEHRFTSAPAECSALAPPPPPSPPVYLRACGVFSTPPDYPAHSAGLPPRLRSVRPDHSPLRRPPRFTSACARSGARYVDQILQAQRFTSAPAECSCVARGHPCTVAVYLRTCGVFHRNFLIVDGGDGLPPRAWSVLRRAPPGNAGVGLPPRLRSVLLVTLIPNPRNRFTSAPAECSRSRQVTFSTATVYLRACGVFCFTLPTVMPASGLPPRVCGVFLIRVPRRAHRRGLPPRLRSVPLVACGFRVVSLFCYQTSVVS